MEQREYKKTRTGEEGQALVLVTVVISLLFGLLGLVIDAGFGYYLKQSAQAAADSGALAAAIAVNNAGGSCVLCTQSTTACPSNPSSATYAGTACLYAQKNGFTNSGNQTVSVSSGTGASTSGTTANYWLTVTATQSLPLTFARMFGSSASTTAKATAGVISTGATGGCIYVMNSNVSQALMLSGNNSFINSDCGIYVNSSSSSALTANGGATVKGSVVNLVGGASIGGGSTVTPSATHVSSVQDPLARLSAPTVGPCDHTSTNISQGTVTLSPGVYCNGIQVSGQANVTFSPGTYILNGGGLSLNSANSTATGSGVFFYNTASGYSAGGLTISGQPNVNFTAPSTGTYRGILFFGDRAISNVQNTVNGSTAATLSGSIYTPSQRMTLSGGSTTAALTLALVCDTLTINGGSYLKKDTTGLVTGMAAMQAMLIE